MALLRGLRTFPCLGERSRRVLGLVLLVGYVTAVAVQMFDHAMWRDEAQAWLIARASPGLLELRQNLRFEGHPPLWHLVIWPVARLSANIELMKGVTFLLAAAFGALIALGRSFPPLLRPLLLAGFLPIFGYGVLSRPYILGLVLLFGWLELYAVELRCGRSTLKWRAVVALLLGLVQLMFTVVAGALLAGEFVDGLRRNAGVRRQRLAWSLGPAVVLLASTILFLPDPSSAAIPDDLRTEALGVRSFAIGFVESAGAFVGIPAPVVLLLVGALVLVAIFVDPGRAGMLWAAILVLVANRLVGYGGAWWHTGVTTFAVLTLGVVAYLRSDAHRADVPKWRRARPAIASLLAFVLVGQVFAARDWYETNRELPYSAGREAAAIVRDWCRPECQLVVDRSSSGSTVLAYLGAQPAYRLNDRREGTFAIWDSAHGTGDVTWDTLKAALEERGRSAVGIVSHLREPPPDFVVIGRTGPAVWKDEEFLIVALVPPAYDDDASELPVPSEDLRSNPASSRG